MSSTIEYEHSLPVAKEGAACDYCHKRKMRCDKNKPQCLECIKRNIKCNYGERLRRGPKMKQPRAAMKGSVIDRTVQKINTQLQAMQFEVEFNQKMVELWKNAACNSSNNQSQTDFAKRIRPKFNPDTEEFIRSPNVVHQLMVENGSTFRIAFSTPNFASNMDFATKIWQAIIDVSLVDLLSMLGTFQTSLLLIVQEHLIIFLLSLKLLKYDDMCNYLAQIVFYVFDTVMYSRDDYCSSTELVGHLLVTQISMASYYKMTKNVDALRTNALTTCEIFSQFKNKHELPQDLQARLCCRMIMGSRTERDRRYYVDMVKAYNAANLPANLLYMTNVSISMQALLSMEKDLSEADTAIQKADYFAKSYILQTHYNYRGPIECYYDAWTGVIHSEIAIRLGDIELSRRKIGRLLDLFSRMTPPLQKLLVSNVEFFMYTMQNKALLVQDYLPLLTKSGVTLTRAPSINTAPMAVQPYNWANSDDSSNNTNEDNSPSSSEGNIVSSIADFTDLLDLGELDDTIFGFDELDGTLLY
jgi:hypothetical protein